MPAFGLVVTAVALALTTTCAAPPPIANSSYELVFDETFEGDRLRPHWATAPFGGSLPGRQSRHGTEKPVR